VLLPPPLAPKVEEPTVMGEMAKNAGDVAASFASGTGAAVKMIGDIYGLASGNMQNPVSRFGAEVSEFWDEKKSADFKQMDAERRKAVDAETSELGKAWAYVKNTLSNPTLLAALAAENLPSMVGPGALGAVSRVGVAKLLTKRLSEEALKAIAGKPFPGNVRQLENLCHWLTVMAPAAEIGAGDLPSDLDAHSGMPESVITAEIPAMPSPNHRASADWEGGLGRLAVKMLQDGDKNVFDALTSRFEKAVLQAALEVTRGRRVEAAQRLGIGRNTITRKLHELGIDD
jgi:hypothetical protein